MNSSPRGNSLSQQGDDNRPQQQQMQPNVNPLSNNGSIQGAQKVANNGVLVQQNSMNLRQQNNTGNAHSSYGGGSHQAVGPSNAAAQVHSTVLPSQTTGAMTQPSSSPFNSPSASSSYNPPQIPYSVAASAAMSSENSPANMPMQQPAVPTEVDGNESQSSVQKIIQEMMMSSQHNNGGNSSNSFYGAATLGNGPRNMSGILPGTNNALYNGVSSMPENGIASNNSGFGTGMVGAGPNNQSSSMVTGFGNTMNSSVSMNGRMGMASLARDQILNQPQDMGSQLMGGLGSINGFNNSQFDWKNSS